MFADVELGEAVNLITSFVNQGNCEFMVAMKCACIFHTYFNEIKYFFVSY